MTEYRNQNKTVWDLQREGVRWTYSPRFKTFFWVEPYFFENNKKELEQFCKDTGSDLHNAKHGWLQVSDDEAVTEFILRWS